MTTIKAGLSSKGVKMKKSDKKRLCSGCRDNRYNMGSGFCERPGIDAVVTSSECWSLETAKVVKRKVVSVNQPPPWTQAPKKVLSCYSPPGYVCVDPRRTK